MKNKVVSIAIILIILGTGIFFQQFYTKNISEKLSTDNQQKESGSTNCPKEWKKYDHPVLGISFCYPEEWGTPKTDPIENLTRLEGAIDQYSTDEHNGYSNSIFIQFDKGPGQEFSKINLRFFNEKYGGEYYPNAYAYSAGYVDNIIQLKSSGNICDYRIDFTKPWEYNGKMTEFWNDCRNGVKNSIIEGTEYFDKTLYSYHLNSWAYRKIKNGYFDNLLINRDYGRITQIETRISGLSQFFEVGSFESAVDNSKILSQDQYRKDNEEFTKFVQSVRVYAPPKPVVEEFRKINNENTNITLIRRYYWLLSGGKIDEAYDMWSGNENIGEFRGWYKDLKSAVTRDFALQPDGNYKFFVDYQDHNMNPTVYRIVMKVEDGKLTTLSSEEITTEMVKSGKYTAYAKKQNGKNYVILEEGGKEKIIDQGIAEYNESYSNISEVKFFTNIKFSPKGNYLIYGIGGWEWYSEHVYSIEKDKNLFEMPGPSNLGFSDDEGIVYACSGAGMASGREGKIIEVPEFKTIYDLNQNKKSGCYLNADCEYSADNNTVKFILSGCLDDDGKKAAEDKEIIYSVDKRTVN